MLKSLAISTISFSLWAASMGAVFAQSDSNCTTISEILCDNDGQYPTETLCEAIQEAGIEDDLDTDEWTVFAPTNEAFETISFESRSFFIGNTAVSNDDTKALLDMLSFHVVAGKSLDSSKLICEGEILMVNEEPSVTICEGDRVYQKGSGNLVTDYPEIIVADIEACNGFVHLISEVMIEEIVEPSASPSITPTDGPSMEPSVTPTDGPSNEPSQVPSDGPSLMPSDGPSMEPSLMPSDGPSNEPSQLPSDGPSMMPSDGPSMEPSVTPTDGPSNEPSQVPSDGPSMMPSDGPSMEPSMMPSDGPSLEPSLMPSDGPSVEPSLMQSDVPSSEPSQPQTDGPSPEPSLMPSDGPSKEQSLLPSDGPSIEPSLMPSDGPSNVSVKPPREVGTTDVEIPSPTLSPVRDPCTIADVVCASSEHTRFCSAISAAGIETSLGDYDVTCTVFAPNDDAFEKLGAGALEYLMDPENAEVLAQVLAFHTVEDEAIFSSDLECKELTTMANGKDSRTVCRKNSIFQKGKGNSDMHRPEITEVDIETCNGVIHVVNEVMLFDYLEDLGVPARGSVGAAVETTSPTTSPSNSPPKPESKEPTSCKTIDQVMCDDPDFSIMCQLLETAGIGDYLSGESWTLFAPNNAAFLRLPPDYVEALTDDEVVLGRLLMFHLVENEILYKDDLPCVAGHNLIGMANGKDSRTLCKDDENRLPIPTIQRGKYNDPEEGAPRFVDFDIEACNGVVHELDGVLLFQKPTPHH